MEGHNLYDYAAEKALLGSALLYNPVLDEVDVQPEDFHREVYGQVWAAMLELQDAGTPIDFITLDSHLEATGRTKGWPSHSADLSDLTSLTPSWLNAPEYAKVVKELATRRRVYEGTVPVIAAACDRARTLEEVLAEVDKLALRQHTNSKVSSANPVMDRIFADILEPPATRVDRVFTKLEALDLNTIGIEEGRYWVCAAFPGTGKTALAVNLVRGVCEGKQNAAILYLHPEQTEFEIMNLLLAAGTDAIRPMRLKMLRVEENQRRSYAAKFLSNKRVDQSVLFGKNFTYDDLVGPLTSEELRVLRLSGAPLHDKLYFHDPSGENILTIRRHIRHVRKTVNRELGPDAFLLVVLDGLHLIMGMGEGNRHGELTAISRNLKAAAQTDAMPGAVWTSHQINYGGWDRNIETPAFTLRDLRDSGSIGQDADVVLFAWRPSAYKRTRLNAPAVEHYPPNTFSLGEEWALMKLFGEKNRQTSVNFEALTQMNKYTMRIEG